MQRRLSECIRLLTKHAKVIDSPLLHLAERRYLLGLAAVHEPSDEYQAESRAARECDYGLPIHRRIGGICVPSVCSKSFPDVRRRRRRQRRRRRRRQRRREVNIDVRIDDAGWSCLSDVGGWFWWLTNVLVYAIVHGGENLAGGLSHRAHACYLA